VSSTKKVLAVNDDKPGVILNTSMLHQRTSVIESLPLRYVLAVLFSETLQLHCKVPLLSYDVFCLSIVTTDASVL